MSRDGTVHGPSRIVAGAWHGGTMDDNNRITVKEAPTLAQLMAASRPDKATERDTRKRSDADRRRLDIINGKRRGRL